MNLALACFLAFGIALGIDIAYTNWVVAVSEKRRGAACLYSALCPMLGSLSLLIFLDHWLTTFPAAVGHALGTYLAMRNCHGLRRDARPDDAVSSGV
jgi:hypothetical protein